MLAAIDVGSNTVRLLLGTAQDGRVVPHQYARRITRLKGGQTSRGLAPEARERTLDALRDFSAIIAEHKPLVVRIVGTEALRSAENGQQFALQVLSETGLNLEVIDGREEALLTASGVYSALTQPYDSILIFDIGGGSTEFVLLSKGVVVFEKSYRIGVVDLTETFAQRGGRRDVILSTLSALVSAIAPVLKQHDISFEELTLVGTAGTATTLAAMDLRMVEYDWRRVNGYVLARNSIEAIYNQLAELSVSERERLPGMEKGRGDLILAGVELTLEILGQFHSDNLTVSDFGLLEGILLTMPTFRAPNR